jgi:peptide/nickel transport system substrate-binding protein
MMRRFGKHSCARRMLGLGLALACAVFTDLMPSMAQAPGMLKVGLSALAEKLDPHTIWAPPGPTAFDPIFDPLARLDAQGQLRPALAVSWRRIDDTTWEFKLRQGVQFQNGQPFTADDVKITLDRLLDKDKVAKYQLIARGQISSVSAVEVADKYTVRIKTGRPDPVLPRSLSVAYILPGAYYQQVGDDGFAARPVGTGPFKLREFAKADHITFDAWNGSWRGRLKVVALSEVLVPEAATRISALRTGELDVANGVPPDQAPGLQRENLKIVPGPVAAQYLCDIWDTKGPLADKRVREAINYAVDKTAIVREVLKGYGAEANGQPFVRGVLGYAPNLKGFPYDPDRAKKLLADAGYANGFELRFQHSVGFVPQDTLLAQAIQGYLGQVGIKVTLEPLEYAAFRQWYFRGDRSPLFCWKMLNYPQLDASALHQIFFYPGANPVHPLPGSRTPSQSGWVNERYKTLVDQSLVAFDDNTRARLSEQATGVMNDDVVHLYMVQFYNLFATRAGIQGLVPRLDENVVFDNVTKP